MIEGIGNRAVVAVKDEKWGNGRWCWPPFFLSTWTRSNARNTSVCGITCRERPGLPVRGADHGQASGCFRFANDVDVRCPDRLLVRDPNLSENGIFITQP
jgi:hypothetical protein